MASGTVKSVTFTPAVAGKVLVTCDYEAAGVSGGEFGGNYHGKVFLTQNSVTTYSEARGMRTTRAAYSITYVFDVVAGLSVTCGLFGECLGATSCSFWNARITAVMIKR
jgi:hypothetical protein